MRVLLVENEDGEIIGVCVENEDRAETAEERLREHAAPLGYTVRNRIVDSVGDLCAEFDEDARDLED